MKVVEGKLGKGKWIVLEPTNKTKDHYCDEFKRSGRAKESQLRSAQKSKDGPKIPEVESQIASAQPDYQRNSNVTKAQTNDVYLLPKSLEYDLATTGTGKDAIERYGFSLRFVPGLFSS